MKRLIHMGTKVRADGAVAALCFAKPRAIDMKRATWTLRAEAVTCRRCARLLSERRNDHAELP